MSNRQALELIAELVPPGSRVLDLGCGDGYGDVAYEVKALSAELTDAHEDLKFFHGTTAMSLVDAIAHAMPVLSAKLLMTDPKPLVRRPAIAEVPR